MQHTTPSRASARYLCGALFTLALAACGADVEPYSPTLSGIVNEGGKGSGDVSFSQGTGVERVADDACADPVIVASGNLSDFVDVLNQYRERTVEVFVVDINCDARSLGVWAPGDTRQAGLRIGNVLRMVDQNTGETLHAWLVRNFPPIGNDRIVMRESN